MSVVIVQCYATNNQVIHYIVPQQFLIIAEFSVNYTLRFSQLLV
jgi:hypothetical protein